MSRKLILNEPLDGRTGEPIRKKSKATDAPATNAAAIPMPEPLFPRSCDIWAGESPLVVHEASGLACMPMPRSIWDRETPQANQSAADEKEHAGMTTAEGREIVPDPPPLFG